MTEDEAKATLRQRFGVSRENVLGRYVDLVLAGQAGQNLIAPSTVDSIWHRHILDSAQLIDHAPGSDCWLDIGSGAGFPGIVIAILTGGHITLVEPRRRRAEFLAASVQALALSNCTVVQCNVERLAGYKPFGAITARAVASLGSLFGQAKHLADRNTCWVLPKGRSAAMEVKAVRHTWGGVFHVEPSITDPTAGIVVAHGVVRT